MDERRLRFEIRKQKKLSQVVVRTEMKLFMFDKTEDQNTKLICFYLSAVSVFICLKKKLRLCYLSYFHDNVFPITFLISLGIIFFVISLFSFPTT